MLAVGLDSKKSLFSAVRVTWSDTGVVVVVVVFLARTPASLSAQLKFTRLELVMVYPLWTSGTLQFHKRFDRSKLFLPDQPNFGVVYLPHSPCGQRVPSCKNLCFVGDFFTKKVVALHCTGGEERQSRH